MSNLDTVFKVPLSGGGLILPLSFPQALSREFRIHWTGGRASVRPKDVVQGPAGDSGLTQLGVETPVSTWVGVARAWESPRRALCSQGDSRVFEAEERSRCSADWWGPALHPVAPRCRAGWVLALSLAERSAGCHNQGAGLTLWDLLPGAGLRSVSSAPTLHTDGPSASARCWAGFPLLLPGSAGRWGLGQGLSSPLPFPRSPRHHPGPAGGSAQGALDGAGAPHPGDS